MKAIRRILILIPITVLALFAAFALLVWLARIEQAVEAAGKVQIERFQVVRPAIQGTVARVFAGPGRTVRRGDPLVEVESFDLERQVEELERSLAESRLALAEARQQRDLERGEIQPREVEQHEEEIRQIAVQEQRLTAQVEELELDRKAAVSRHQRLVELAKHGLISDIEVQDARNEIDRAEWRVRQGELQREEARLRGRALQKSTGLLDSRQRRRTAERETEVGELTGKAAFQRAEIARLRERLTRGRLAASLDGWVTGPRPNELVGRQVQPGEELMSVIDLRSVRFVSRVPEEAIVRVRPGQQAYVEMTGLPRRRFDVFPGEVVRIDQQPVVGETDGRTFYRVEIDLSQGWVERGSERFYLRNGMGGVAKIVYRPNVRLLRALVDFVVGREE